MYGAVLKATSSQHQPVTQGVYTTHVNLGLRFFCNFALNLTFEAHNEVVR